MGLFEFINSEEIEKIMKEFSYMLKQNGKLVITTPNFKLGLRTLLKVSQYLVKQDTMIYIYQSLLELLLKNFSKNKKTLML